MPITPADVAVALGRPLPYSEQAAQWQVFIDDVRLRLRLRVGDLAGLDQEVVDYVTREAVVAMVLSQDESNPSPDVFIKQEWIDLLQAVDEVGAFSVLPSFVPDHPTQYRPGVGFC